MITAILFDMDGVLIDSEEYISAAAIAYFKSLGVETKPEDYIPFVGAGENRYIGGVAEKYGVEIEIEQAKLDTYAIYEELIMGKEGALDGVIRFINNAHKAGIDMVIATSADKRKMEINLEAMNLDPAWFKVLINGKDIERKKPFPDIYLKAANDIGKPQTECLVFEDATNGVEAAKAAGSLCGGITTSFSREELLNYGADFIIEGLKDFPDFETLEQFNDLVNLFLAREAALKTRVNAYTPYSHFQVGAAIISKEGQIYSGCNVENSSYGATICAERGAVMAGVAQEGAKFAIERVVVVSDGPQPAPPCAICLQVLAEFITEEGQVHLFNLAGEELSYSFKEMLPHPFKLNLQEP
jgi:homotetrameric cytidine deaminase